MRPSAFTKEGLGVKQGSLSVLIIADKIMQADGQVYLLKVRLFSV